MATVEQQIENWQEELKAPTADLRRSPTIGKLIEALSKAQLEFEPVKKENSNPFFKSKYADLATVLSATQKHLAKYGLVVMQEPVTENGRAGVITTIGHSSGEWKEHSLLLPVAKQDAQGIGSAITYARRYSLQSIIGVAAEEDDDGNGAMSKPYISKSTIDYEREFDQRVEGKVTQSQWIALNNTCKDNGKTPDQLAAYLKTKGVDKPEQMTPEIIGQAIKWAYGKEELTETLKASVKAVKKPKKDEPEVAGVPLNWQKKTEITDEDIPF